MSDDDFPDDEVVDEEAEGEKLDLWLEHTRKSWEKLFDRQSMLDTKGNAVLVACVGFCTFSIGIGLSSSRMTALQEVFKGKPPAAAVLTLALIFLTIGIYSFFSSAISALEAVRTKDFDLPPQPSTFIRSTSDFEINAVKATLLAQIAKTYDDTKDAYELKIAWIKLSIDQMARGLVFFVLALIIFLLCSIIA